MIVFNNQVAVAGSAGISARLSLRSRLKCFLFHSSLSLCAESYSRLRRSRRARMPALPALTRRPVGRGQRRAEVFEEAARVRVQKLLDARGVVRGDEQADVVSLA